MMTDFYKNGIKHTPYTLKSALSEFMGFTQEYVGKDAPRFCDMIAFCDLHILEESISTYPILKDDDSSNEIWYRVVNKYKDEIIFIQSELEEAKELFKDFINDFFVIYRNTHEKYEYLINLYSAQLNNLMNTLKETSNDVNVYIDTPQNSFMDKTIEETVYATNMNKNKIEISKENEPVIDRIAKIQTSLRNLYNDWIKRFSVIFIERRNYEVEDYRNSF